MLKKKARLTSREFDEVIKNGRISQSTFFSLRYLVSSSTGNPKIAAVAPAKMAKTAVIRNRIRRRIYAALRTIHGKLPKGLVAVLIAKNPVLSAKSKELASETHNLFVKASILK